MDNRSAAAMLEDAPVTKTQSVTFLQHLRISLNALITVSYHHIGDLFEGFAEPAKGSIQHFNECSAKFWTIKYSYKSIVDQIKLDVSDLLSKTTIDMMTFQHTALSQKTML